MNTGKKLYLLTGASGHLGHALLHALENKDADVRVLCHRNSDIPFCVETVIGDVCDKDSLLPFFHTEGYDQVTLIHCAAVVTIATKEDPRVWNVNLEGTRDVFDLAMKSGISRVIYVSSAHAIVEEPAPNIITEPSFFSSALVHGQYAKSKAAAAKLALQFAKEGLPVSIVHPSGIIGPFDHAKANHMTRSIEAMAKGTIPMPIQGGYDFVDVRDVAQGILQCEDKGKSGECYLLTGHYLTVEDLLKLVCNARGRRYLPLCIPAKLAEFVAPMGELISRSLGSKPLLTPYSVYTLQTNAMFSHQKASDTFGYNPRPIEETIEDTLLDLGLK